ncbi:MAG: hypothetical protein KDC24_14120, partial [Saprospiraceae bacterium]|nr:hypothetical protein [Saprospiraceae bacterium]
NVIPSSNALFAEALYKLGKLSGEQKYLDIAYDAVRQVYQIATEEAVFYDYFHWLKLAMLMGNPGLEVVVMGDHFKNDLLELNHGFQPDIVFAGSGTPSTLPLLSDKFVKNQNTIYVCRDHVCRLPVNTPQAAVKLIAEERVN